MSLSLYLKLLACVAAVEVMHLCFARKDCRFDFCVELSLRKLSILIQIHRLQLRRETKQKHQLQSYKKLAMLKTLTDQIQKDATFIHRKNNLFTIQFSKRCWIIIYSARMASGNCKRCWEREKLGPLTAGSYSC